MITNAGGLNPLGCARACGEALRQAGCAGRTIAVVSGDDVLDLVRTGGGNDELLQNMDTGRPIADVRDRLLTANAYLGAQPVAAALQSGADLVITGRLADPSLTLAACAHWFGWKWDDWDRLAGGTIAGHLIECGTQLTGGIATDWLETPDVERIGFPDCRGRRRRELRRHQAARQRRARLPRDGQGATRLRDRRSRRLSLARRDRFATWACNSTTSERTALRIGGARGRPAPPTYKVSATYQDGFRAQGQLTVFGRDAVAKARRAGQAVLSRLSADGVSLGEAVVECLGAGACRPQGVDPTAAQQLTETVLRIAVADGSREAVERFARELMPLVTAGPPGTTGYAEGRPRVHPLFRFWPCLDRAGSRQSADRVAARCRR